MRCLCFILLHCVACRNVPSQVAGIVLCYAMLCFVVGYHMLLSFDICRYPCSLFSPFSTAKSTVLIVFFFFYLQRPLAHPLR